MYFELKNRTYDGDVSCRLGLLIIMVPADGGVLIEPIEAPWPESPRKSRQNASEISLASYIIVIDKGVGDHSDNVVFRKNLNR